MMIDGGSLRRTLSDELHARAFNNFSGAGRFVRFVYLIDGNTEALIQYVNAFLSAEGHTFIPAGSKFAIFSLDEYSLEYERHTEFVSISFIQKTDALDTGLLSASYDESKVPLPLELSLIHI